MTKKQRGTEANRKSDEICTGQPQVGIFWSVGGRVIVDATPLEQAGTYFDFAIHEGDHITYWSKLQAVGQVPLSCEYEEHPRGRVVYDRRKREFVMYADRCILKSATLVAEIVAALRLPTSARKLTDPHYRCTTCLCSETLNFEDD